MNFYAHTKNDKDGKPRPQSEWEPLFSSDCRGLRGLPCDLCESLAGEKDLGFMLHDIEFDQTPRPKAVKIAHALQTAVKIFFTGASAKNPGPLPYSEMVEDFVNPPFVKSP